MRVSSWIVVMALCVAGIAPAQGAEAKAEGYRKQLAQLGCKVTGSGTTAKGELGKSEPGGAKVEVHVACHATAAAARTYFADDLTPYWTVNAKRVESGPQVKIYCRMERVVHDNGAPNAEGIAIGQCVVGDVTLTVLASHYGPGGDRRLEDQAVLALLDAAVATVRTWLGKLGGPVEVPKEKPGDGPQVELLDANPTGFKAFDKLIDVTDEETAKRVMRYLDQQLAAASLSGEAREGCVADGASVLVVRARYQARGRVKMTLTGEQGPGALVRIGVDPWVHPGTAALEVETWANPTSPDVHWALALYVPPAARGPQKGLLQVTLALEHAAEDKKLLQSRRVIFVSRPPVVLVHGTFDNPKDCWYPADRPEPERMYDRLTREGFRVFMVDWQETNGHKDPSSFAANRMTVWQRPGGIKDALAAMRSLGFAATQADLVCHSQGGVIARVYAKGTVLEKPLPDDDYHFTSWRDCARGACHYHRPDNFGRGDIHRLITISSTHMGSDVCRLLHAVHDVKEDSTEVRASILVVPVSLQGNADWLGWARELIRRIPNDRLWTEGYRDQDPDCAGLNGIGKTVIPAHAIACVAGDADLPTHGGEYMGRMVKVWSMLSRDALEKTFRAMGQDADVPDLLRLRDEEAQLGGIGQKPRLVAHIQKSAFRLRQAMFGNQPNDCVVRVESSRGKLEKRFTTDIPGVLHGIAPRYATVQDRVVELLNDLGGAFCPTGFPAAGGKLVEK